MTDNYSGCSLEAMYSAFPVQRNDNWDSKMSFWMSAIQGLCLSRKTAVFNLTQLPLDFQKQGRTPKCLATVVQQMVSQGLVRRLSFYVEELDPEGSSWSIWDFVQRPIAFSFNWAYQKLFSSKQGNESSNSGTVAQDEFYVMVELVKTFAEGINEVHRINASLMPSAENLISYRALMQMSKEIVDDERSFRLALLHLSAQNRCSIATGDDGQKVVRLVESGDEFVEPSTFELKLFRMKTMADKLETTIENIEQLMARYKQSAKESLNKGNRNEALRFLRRKKQLEVSVGTKELTLERILTLITALEQTESQKQALDAYRSGMEAFKMMKDDFGLSVDEIDKTMMNMQEMFDDNHEFEKTMSLAFNAPTTSASEDDLEKELNELLDSPDPSPRQINAAQDAKVGAGVQPERPSQPVAIEGYSLLFKLRSSPRAKAVNKTPIQFPDVPLNEPMEVNSVDTTQPATKPVKSRSDNISPRSQPPRVAKKRVATKS